MVERPYNNTSSQRERRATIKNDERVHKNTFHSHAHDDLSGGRFAKEFSTEKVGATPVPRYPSQPQGAPWADRLPDEPPLGYAVDEPPIVGEFFEVQKSLGEAHSDNPSADQGALLGGEERSVSGGDPSGRPRRRSTRKKKR